jgi:hypothetical protein
MEPLSSTGRCIVVKRPFVIVVWDDAHGDAQKVVSEDDFPHKPVVMKTMGWLLRDDTLGISLANEEFQEDGKDYFRGHSFIPREMVRSCTPMTLAKSRKKKTPCVESPSSPLSSS